MCKRTQTNLRYILHAHCGKKKKKRKKETLRTTAWRGNQHYQEVEIPVWKTCRTFLSSEAANSNNSAVSDTTPLNHTHTYSTYSTHTKAVTPTSLTSHKKLVAAGIYCYSPHSPPIFSFHLPLPSFFSPLLFLFHPDYFHNLLCFSFLSPTHSQYLLSSKLMAFITMQFVHDWSYLIS